MSDIDLRNGVRVTVKAPAPRFTVSAPSSTVAVLPVRGPAGADGTGGTGGGVSDHGALTGLADDDHPHYALADGTRGNFATPGHAHTYTAADVGAEPAGTVDAHSADTTAVHGIADTAALVVTTDPRLSDARTPTAHTHPTTDVTGLGTAATKNTPATGNAAATEIVLGSDSRLSDARTPTTHLHDDRYYTETEVDTALAGKAATSHNHVAADVTDLGTAATKDTPTTGDALAGQVVVGSDTRLTDPRTPAAHTHPATDVTFTPSGNLAATDVQAALVELDTEKETPAGAQAKVDTHAEAPDPHGDRAWATGQFAPKAYRGVRVGMSVAQSIPRTTVTLIAFDVEKWDTDGWHDNAVNNTRLVVPAGLSGKFLILAGVGLFNTTGSYRQIRINKNGFLDTIVSQPPATFGRHFVATVATGVPGDVFEMAVEHDATTAINAEAGDNTYLTIHHIGV